MGNGWIQTQKRLKTDKVMCMMLTLAISVDAEPCICLLGPADLPGGVWIACRLANELARRLASVEKSKPEPGKRCQPCILH